MLWIHTFKWLKNSNELSSTLPEYLIIELNPGDDSVSCVRWGIATNTTQVNYFRHAGNCLKLSKNV